MMRLVADGLEVAMPEAVQLASVAVKKLAVDLPEVTMPLVKMPEATLPVAIAIVPLVPAEELEVTILAVLLEPTHRVPTVTFQVPEFKYFHALLVQDPQVFQYYPHAPRPSQSL